MTPPIKVDFTDNLPANLPRPSGLRLSIEPIPQTTQGINLRSKLTAKQWDVLRRKVYAKANYRCDACDADNVEVHCHEVWAYNDKKHVQKLIGLRCLCWECHGATHLLHPDPKLFELASLHHLARVNGITIFKANKILSKTYLQWSIRSEHKWKIDTSWLDSYLKKEKDNESTTKGC